jgi:DNA polymerase epsilon subunit 2
MVLIEGEYTIDETIRVLAMGHPPSEKRDVARYVYIGKADSRALHGHVDFSGTGAISLKEEVGQV